MAKQSRPQAEILTDHFKEYMQMFDGQNDYAVTLVGASILDESLAILLRKSFVDDGKVSDKILRMDGPLGTFSSRIQLAYCLGLLDADQFHDLEIIRKIRNDFAHHPLEVRFSSESVKNRCGELRCLNVIREFVNSNRLIIPSVNAGLPTRYAYQMCVTGLTIEIQFKYILAEDSPGDQKDLHPNVRFVDILTIFHNLGAFPVEEAKADGT